MEQIIGIELLPTANTKSSIKNRLGKSLRECTSVKGAIAYWTIKTDYMSDLVDALSKKESFVCIDIQSPTNIDELAIFTQNGCNIYLHHFEISKEIANKENKLPALLHTKTLLFEFKDKTEIWVGSHNFTCRALDGANFELTTIITTKKKSNLEEQLYEYLTLIKANCIPFNIADIEFYKQLQGEHDDDFVDVIEFVGYNLNSLAKEQMIQLISKDISNFDKLKLIDRNIILHGLDLDTEKDHIFQAKIINAGSINQFNQKSYEITFSPRRYAIRERNMFPFLQKQGTIDEKLLKIAAYFINIQIDKELTNTKLFEKPLKKDEHWDYVNDSIHLQRMTQEDKDNLFSYSQTPIRKASKKNIQRKEICLSKIILKENQKFLIDNYEKDTLELKYVETSQLKDYENFKIPDAVRKRQVIIKRILRKE